MFLSHILLKFVAQGGAKFELEKDGFDGFGIGTEVIKSRTNQAGQICNLVYDKLQGIDSLRTSLRFAKDAGLTGGNKNGMYFGDNKDVKFKTDNLHAEFKANPELYKSMYSYIIPVLEERLSAVTEDELQFDDNLMDY